MGGEISPQVGAMNNLREVGVKLLNFGVKAGTAGLHIGRSRCRNSRNDWYFVGCYNSVNGRNVIIIEAGSGSTTIRIIGAIGHTNIMAGEIKQPSINIGS